MPLTRYQIRNEFSLADPELYRAADKDDPEALLEGVAMAGLVGLLRQLGDLAEFAAEIFHDLHEEVMATAARGHGLTLRVQQLEADFPAMESAFLSQINHSIFLHNSGVDWHPNLKLDGSLVTQGDLPRFVMDSYEECRGPPRLFLLDKFDIAGAGACLKRYTDPSFFKAEFTAAEVAKEKLKRENKAFKVKKNPSRWRNGDIPEATASNSKLHELLLEERCQSENNVHTHHVKLKRRHSTNSLVDSSSGKSYMERFINKHSPDSKFVCESSAISSPSKTRSIDISGLMCEREIHEMSSNELVTRERSLVSSHSQDQTVPRASLDKFDVDVVEERNPKKLFESGPAIELENIPSSFFKVENKELVVDTTGNAEATVDGYHSDDVNSELENYTDALTTMDSEIETDTESKPKNERGLKIGRKSGEFETNEEQKDVQTHFSDSQSIASSVVSEDGNDSLQKSRFISSYPDIFCNAVENISSDGDLAAKEQQSAENVDTRNVSDSPSHSRDNSLSVRSHKGDTRRTLNKINCNASHENFIHLSNGVGSVEEGKDVDVDINETLPVGVAVDKHNENQTNVKIDSPDSVLVNSETELNDLVQGDVEARLGTQWDPTCGPDSPTDTDMHNQRSDGTFVDLKEVMSSGEKVEYLTSMVDCPEIDDFREQKDLKITDQAPLLELDKAEDGIGDSAVEAAGNTLESSESSYFGVMETSSNSDISHELPFTCTISDATKLVSAAEAPLEVVNAETTNLCSEGVEDTVMHNGLIGSNNADLNQTTEACDVNILTRSNGNKVGEYNQIAASSYCIDQLCNQEKSYPSSHEFLADVHDPLMVDHTKMHLDITEDAEVPSSMKERDQSKELRQPLPSFLAVNVKALSTHSAEAEVLHEGQEYEHAESPNHMHCDECSTAPPKSSSMDYGSQPADLNLFSPIISYEFDRPEPSVLPSETISQGLALHPDTTNQPLLDTQPHRPILAISLPDDNVLQDSVEEKPPLPPLPPMQWRTGKLRSPTSGEDTTLPSFSKSSLLSADTTECMAEESYPSSRGSYAQPLNPFLPHPTSDTENPQHDFQMLGSDVVQPSLIPSSLLVPAVEYLNVRSDPSLDLTITKPLNLLLPLIDEGLQHGSSNSEEEVLQHNSLNQFTPGSPTEDSSTRYVSLNLQEEGEQSAESLTKCREDDNLRPQISTTPPTMENEKDGHESQTLEGELKWQSNSLAVVPTIDNGKPNGSIKSRLPRPRDPLIEAVASHDKSNLRKVTERIIPQIRPEVDERNSLLEQIRTKSFNLKPAVATRPSIHGPKTNLKVVAILEKANAIRQALAGSDDDDDDEDSWSDS